MVIKKFNRSESAQKIHASMCWCNMHVHTILVGVTSTVSEIQLLSKTAKFSFLTMDYSPWSSKNLIDRNQLKKFMQVCVDVTCMHTNFGGCRPFRFSEIQLLSKTAKFPFLTIDYSPWSSKNLIDRNWLKKFMQVCVDVTCMYTNFGGHDLSLVLGDTATLKNGQISLSDHGTIVHGHQKI